MLEKQDEKDEFSEDLPESPNDQNSEMVKYCSECLTMENLLQIQALQSELDLKLQKVQRNCHQCQNKVNHQNRLRTN